MMRRAVPSLSAKDLSTWRSSAEARESQEETTQIIAINAADELVATNANAKVGSTANTRSIPVIAPDSTNGIATVAGRKMRAAVPPLSALVKCLIQPCVGRANKAPTNSTTNVNAVESAIPANQETP